ncbi:MAG: hypothetical protein ABI649_08635 [Gaiellaceae bacterium]
MRERPDAPLGTLIFRAGLLPAETIENALEEGVKTGRRLGEILIERGLLQEEDLTRLLAGQKGLSFVSLREERIDLEATKMLSEDQARLFTALPIRFEEGIPVVAVADPTNDVLTRNIREALGQEARFVVAPRSELNDVIGEAYSGTLPAFEPPAEPELPPLRVDTSIPPGESEPEAEAEPELTAAYEPDPEPAPLPALDPEPEPAFEASVFEPDPEPVVQYEPEPAPVAAFEPEPEPEPVAPAYEAPAPAPVAEAPAPNPAAPALPAYEEPVAPQPVVPVSTETPIPQALPETNGRVPQDFEDDTPPSTSPASTGAAIRVSIRLTTGERVTVADCADLGEAKGYAKALTKQLGATDPDDWPFVAGRFLKPDTIISVDIEEI